MVLAVEIRLRDRSVPTKFRKLIRLTRKNNIPLVFYIHRVNQIPQYHVTMKDSNRS